MVGSGQDSPVLALSDDGQILLSADSNQAVLVTSPDGSTVSIALGDSGQALGFRPETQEAGASLAQAVRVGVYLRDFANFAEMNEIFAQYFTGDAPPVRTTIPVALDFDIEVDAILYTG